MCSPVKDENGGAEVQEEEACKAEDAASPQTQMTASDIKKVAGTTV